MCSVASLLPSEKQIKPLVYLADDYDQFPILIIEALAFVRSNKYKQDCMSMGIEEFNAEKNLDKLRSKFLEIFNIDIYCENKKYSALYKLDIRLARHFGFSDNRNSIAWNLKSFLNYLENRGFRGMSKDVAEFEDFEVDISRLSQYGEREEANLGILNFQKRLMALILSIYQRLNTAGKF
jgi:hypothetical protein